MKNSQWESNNKLKENEKKGKYLDLAWELKKNKLKLTIGPREISALGRVTLELFKGLEDLDIRERVGTIETTTLLRTYQKKP